ncbi:UNVERIFIED_CONTAM: hypothetical protein RMT77_016682 [Armadillidium vulgare]
MEVFDQNTEYKTIEEIVADDTSPSANFNQVLTLVRKRGVKRANVTKLLNNITTNMPNYSDIEINSFIKTLKIKETELSELDNEILDIYTECSEFSFEGSEKLNTKNDFYQLGVATIINELQSKLTTVHPQSQQNISYYESGNSGLKRPEIQLPIFDGKPEKFDRFIKNFEEIMDRERYNKYAKHSCLLKQLKGPAKVLIEKSPAADMDYEAAKNLLIAAFSNKDIQKFAVIENLCKLKLTNDFYAWISEAKLIESQISSLNITSDIFVQYFLWSGLPEQYKIQYMNVTNKTYPDLNDILKFGFEIQNRLKEGGNFDKNQNTKTNNATFERKTVALATNIDVNDKQKTETVYRTGCTICCALKTSDCMEHKIYNCPKFTTPESKVQKLNELNGCIICGYTNHTLKNCRFRFSTKCRNCNRWHANYLCVTKQTNSSQKGENKNKNKNRNKNKSTNESNVQTVQTETTTNVVELNVVPVENPSSEQVANSLHLTTMHATSTQNIILPTFTVTSINKNNNSHDLRVLYDSGSEFNFVSQSVAEKIKFKVVQSDIMLNIKGFNNQKYYKTYIIEIEVKINNKMCKIVAAVVPSINPKINMPSTQILNAFQQNKLPLADKHLGNKNNREINIILGVQGAHVLPLNSCAFGLNDNISLLYYTSCGIVLAGDLNKLGKNLPYLKYVKNFTIQADLLSKNVKIENKRD